MPTLDFSTMIPDPGHPCRLRQACTLIVSLRIFFKKVSRRQQKHEQYPASKELKNDCNANISFAHSYGSAHDILLGNFSKLFT